MTPNEQTIRAHDGIALISRRYEPAEPAGDGRTLVIVHGASEYGARYDHVARLFADRGWTVIVGDNRGHGRSGGIPMHVRRFEDYLQDLDAIYEHHRLDASRTAQLGHSFGSLISARFAQTRSHKLSALVMLAPLLRLKTHVNPLVVAWGRLLSLVIPTIRFESRVDPNDTTRDAASLTARNADSLIHRSITCGWFFQMRTALSAAWDDADKLHLPLLIVQGGADRIVDPEVVPPWFQLVRSTDKELRLIPGHFHELHHEPDWLETLTGVAEWLEERFNHAPVAAAQKAGSSTPVS